MKVAPYGLWFLVEGMSPKTISARSSPLDRLLQLSAGRSSPRPLPWSAGPPLMPHRRCAWPRGPAQWRAAASPHTAGVPAVLSTRRRQTESEPVVTEHEDEGSRD